MIAALIVVGYIVVGGIFGVAADGFDIDEPDWTLIGFVGLFWPVFMLFGVFMAVPWALLHLARVWRKKP